jgi:hypothetical protein
MILRVISEATRHPHPQEARPMSITTAKQMARQAEEARRAAREHEYTVQSLRKQHLIA